MSHPALVEGLVHTYTHTHIYIQSFSNLNREHDHQYADIMATFAFSLDKFPVKITLSKYTLQKQTAESKNKEIVSNKTCPTPSELIHHGHHLNLLSCTSSAD